ncbi:lpg1661 family Dot/Icm T4SS effector [soil metagenome]
MMVSMQPVSQPVPQPRVLSIDILRGLTIALMIVVNDAGDGAHIWWPLEHAPWNGYTPTDLVFPTFLFLVGCSIVFSMAGRLARGASKAHLASHVVRRSVLIILLGWFLTLAPYFPFTALRFYGVLPRIGLCYLIAGLIFIGIQRARTLVVLTAVLLVGYWILMRFVPVPGFGTPTHEIPLLDPDQNLVAWLDRHIVAFTQHYLHTGRLYQTVRDPEGLLSTLPSVATTLLGILAGLYMRSSQPVRTKTLGLLGSGAASLAAGYLWSVWFPINKKLWTSSYVLVSAGWALLLLGALYWLLDVRQEQLKSKLVSALIWPFRVFGSNAIAAYTVSVVFIKAMIDIHVGTTPTGRPLTLLGWVYRNIFASHGSTEFTSHAFAVAFTLLCFLPIWFLWRKKIFLKI